MKKRLKNLLALCMVAMMMLAMSTGVVSAETYYANMEDGGVEQYKSDKNNGNDPRTLYRGIPDNGTIAMNPGDVIVPLELTGASKDPERPQDAAGKYDDFCGQPFFIVKSVAGNNLEPTYETTLNNALSSAYKEAYKDKGLLSTVYQYDSSWNDCKTIRKLYTSDTNQVKIKDMVGELKDVIIQEWQAPSDDEETLMETELEKFKFYDVAYDESGVVQGPSIKPIPESTLLKLNNNITANAFMRLNIGSESNSEVICSALELPGTKGSGYHYNVKKISVAEWDETYGSKFSDGYLNANNVPTGIKPLQTSGTEVNYNVLVDTIFTYKQTENDSSKYDYGGQLHKGLEITKEQNTYTINFDANGGEGTMNSITRTYGKGETDNLPANKFTKTGYKFAGWEIEEVTYPDPIDPSLAPIKVDTTQAPYKALYADEAEYIPGNHNETVTLTAQWEAKGGYTVKYDTNGGTPDPIDPKKDVKWTDKVIPASNPTKNGYEFKGWECVKVDGKDITPITVEEDTTYADIMEAYAAQTVDEKVNDKLMNVTLQAQWEEKSNYTIKYNTNSNESPNGQKTGVKWTDKVLDKIKGIVISKTGYTFNGWKHKTTEVSDAMTYGYLAVDDAAESIILDAQWTANTYTVKFDANGGSGEMATQTLTYDKEEALNANEFTKTGYTFTGWNDEADGKGEHNYSNQEKVKNLASEKDAEVTLYAQWKANDYTVKFDTDGGSDIADKTVKWEDNVLADVEDPTKDGFTFKGWKYGEADVTADTTYSALAEDDAIEELILTAQWEEVVVPVDEPDDKSPTGDNMNITLLMALLLLSGCGIAGAGLYRRNHVK